MEDLILEVPDLNSLIKKLDLIQFTTNIVITLVKVHYQKYLIKLILIYKIQKINYMSGSLRVFASKKKNDKIKYRKISLSEFNLFKKKVFITIQKIREFIIKNKPVIGIGAATKGNTLFKFLQF